MATIKDVALRADVSVATVSYVLNGRKTISPKVTARVLLAAKELNYRPNRSAQTLRTGHSKTIGLLLPDITNPFFPTLAQAIESNARRQGYVVIFIDTRQDAQVEQEALELLAEYDVAGTIWCPVANEVPVEPAFPIVLVDRPIDGFDAVYADFFHGGKLAAEYAYRLGHRRVGLLSGPQTLKSAYLRREGFLAGADKKLELIWDIEVPFSTALPDEVCSALLARDVSLVVAADDAVAVGVLKLLRGASIEVPDDMSVIGFDDISWAELVCPTLSTVRQPVAELGKRAVLLLHERLKKPSQRPQEVVLGVDLVERESTRKVI